MERELKIQIIGTCNSGKSNIALLIKDTLSIHGIDIQINETEFSETEEKLRSIRPEAIRAISEGYRDKTIQLDVVQSVKQLSTCLLYTSPSPRD